MLKLSDNPEILYPPYTEVASIPGTWWVGHTKSRCEKAFANDLAAKEIAYFLPMVEQVTFSGGRKRRGMMPLFAGYVFFAGDEQVRYQALLTDRLCGVIAPPVQTQLVKELAALHQVIASGATIDPYPFAAVGRRCRVARGAFEGVEGTIVRRENAAPRLVLQVSMLGQGASVEIEAGMLEPLD